MLYEQLQAAADAIAEATRPRHDVAAVLGSGLSSYAAALPTTKEISYSDIPGFPITRVEGHAGSLYSAEIANVPVLLFAGRVHTYEGWEMADVVFGVRAAILAGCRTVVLTNAAGGVNPDYKPGDLVLIRDHINLTGRNPLVGPNDPRLGTRFPDMSAVYDPTLRARAQAIAADLGTELNEGVYAWFIGPSYETPAEVQMASLLGADLVGMSTVPEAIAARHMGASVVGISLVTNHAAGVGDKPLSHDEVTETAAQARERFSNLLDVLLPRVA